MGKFKKIALILVVVLGAVLLSQNCSSGFQSIDKGQGDSSSEDPSLPPVPVVGLGESNCTDGIKSAPIGENPWCDERNVHRFLKNQVGECLSPEALCGAKSIKQFKVSELGYIGLGYGLPGSIQVQIDLDGDGQPENVTKYSGSLGTYTSYHQPVAVTHTDAMGARKTYFVFSGPVQLDNENNIADTDMDSTPEFARADGRMNALGIYIGEYNQQTQQVSRPRLVHVKDVSDPHDNAVVNVDNEGYVYVMVAGRGLSRGAFVYRSRAKNSISDFIHLTPKNLSYQNHFQAITGLNLFSGNPQYRGLAYPQMYWIGDAAYPGGGYFFLIYTVYCNQAGAGPSCTGTRQIYSAELTLNAAKTQMNVTAIRPLLAYGGHYVVSYAKGKTIVLAANIHYQGNVDNRTNLYFMYSEDGGKQWKTIDAAGNPVVVNEFPLNSDARMDKIAVKKYYGESDIVQRRIYLADIHFYYDSNGKMRPVILYVGALGPGSDVPSLEGDRYLAAAYLENGLFVTSRISNDIDHNYSAGFLQPLAQSGSYRIYFPFTATNKSATADAGTFKILNLPFIDTENSIAQNNALAGGRVASTVINFNTYAAILDADGKVVQFHSPALKARNSDNYLQTMCEFNYIRPALNALPTDRFVGIAAAGNQYQAVGVNNVPNNPLFILDAAGAQSLLRKLPMSIALPQDQVPKINDFECN